MRRKDREMPKEFAYEVCDEGEWGTLSMVDANNKPYCVPLSMVRKDNCVYFHCAREGKKSEILNINNEVCICCVGYTCPKPKRFVTEYESAIVYGEAFEVLHNDEKIQVLKWLCQKHAPVADEAIEAEIQAHLQHTAVWKVEIKKATGKRLRFAKEEQ